MSLIFNQLPADVIRALAIHATRDHRTVEEVALEALERGLAFAQDAEEETSWVENPQFDAALQAFAEMERD